MGRTREGELIGASTATIIATTRGLFTRSQLFAYDGSTLSRLLVEDSTNPNLRTAIYDGTSRSRVAGGDSDGQTASNLGLLTTSRGFMYNETGWDRQRGNTEETALASAARTATTTSSDLTNYNARGVIVRLNVTAVPGGDTVKLTLQYKDPATAGYVTILDAPAFATATASIVCLYPGIADTETRFSAFEEMPLPRTWRVRIVHSAGSSFTYSVSVCYIV